MFGAIASMFGARATTADDAALYQQAELISRRLEDVKLMMKILIIGLYLLLTGVWILILVLTGRKIQTAVKYLATKLARIALLTCALVLTVNEAFTGLAMRVSLIIAAYTHIAGVAAVAACGRAAAVIHTNALSLIAATVGLAELAYDGLRSATAFTKETSTLATDRLKALNDATQAGATANNTTKIGYIAYRLAIRVADDLGAMEGWLTPIFHPLLKYIKDMFGSINAKAHAVRSDRDMRTAYEENFGLGMKAKARGDGELCALRTKRDRDRHTASKASINWVMKHKENKENGAPDNDAGVEDGMDEYAGGSSIAKGWSFVTS